MREREPVLKDNECQAEFALFPGLDGRETGH